MNRPGANLTSLTRRVKYLGLFLDIDTRAFVNIESLEILDG